MNYAAIHTEVNTKRDEIFYLCEGAVIDYITNHGVQKNPFIETLWIDVSEWEIEMWCPRHEAYIDEIYYIPSKHELGYVIYEEYTNKVFKTGTLTRSYSNIVTTLFDILCKFDTLKS